MALTKWQLILLVGIVINARVVTWSWPWPWSSVPKNEINCLAVATDIVFPNTETVVIRLCHYKAKSVDKNTGIFAVYNNQDNTKPLKPINFLPNELSRDSEEKLRSVSLPKMAIPFAPYSFIKFVPIKLVYHDDVGVPGLDYWNICNDVMVPEFCIESERISYSTKHLWTTVKNHIKSIRPRGAHTIIAGRVTLSKQNEDRYNDLLYTIIMNKKSPEKSYAIAFCTNDDEKSSDDNEWKSPNSCNKFGFHEYAYYVNCVEADKFKAFLAKQTNSGIYFQ